MKRGSSNDTTKEVRAREENHGQQDSGAFELAGNERDDIDVCRHALESIPHRSQEIGPGVGLADETCAIPRFERIRLVGSGGFGVVFSAFDRTLEIDVAIKFLRPSRVSSVARKRFFEEAKITAGLTHPNIVRMYDSGLFREIPYISSAFLDGGSLADLIRSSPNGMESRDVAEIGCQVADAVAFAHSKATFHRDLKPSNILIQKGLNGNRRIQATLTDFGLAKRWDREIDHGLTLDGEVPGTVRYMSPEQVRGDSDDFSIQSEVFSLGIILYQMATGSVPFDGVKNSVVRNLIENHRPKNPSAVIASFPKDLESIILKCLEKEASHRYDSVAELAKDLRRFLNGEPVIASRPSQLRQAVWFAKTHPLTSTLVLSTFLILLSSASLIGYAFWNQKIATVKEFKTKVDYIVLFGSLIDDVVAGKKDQQIALLDALSSFRNNLVEDLATNPQNEQLQHLLSLIFHYESIVNQRASRIFQCIESRIESVAILKELRFRYPDNPKYRFQYIYGIVTLCVSLGAAQLEMPEQYARMRAKLGVGNGPELLNKIWPEIDRFRAEFPENKTYISACTQFKNDVVQISHNLEPETLTRIKDEVIAESTSLADENPENPEFIKPALTAVQQKLSKSLARGDYSEAMLHMNQSNELFDKYLQKSFDKLWVKVYYLEMKTSHAQCLFEAKRIDLLQEVLANCIPLCNELRTISENRFIGSSCYLKLQTLALLCDDAANDTERSQMRKKQILFALQNPETPTNALSEYAGWIKLLDAPDDVSISLAEQLTLREGPR